MASQNTERIALWMAHGKRCVYCGDPIYLRDLEIDHILPVSLKNNPLQLAQLKEELGLSADFSLNSISNSVPTHASCNLRKSGRVFSPANARYFLEIAGGKLHTIDKLIPALQLQTVRESLIWAVQNAIQSGNVSLDDLIEAVTEVKEFPLSTQIEFIDGAWDGQSHPKEIEELLDKPILLGGTTSIDGVEFVNKDGGSIVIRTCREYRVAKAAGYYARTNLAMKMEAFLAAANAVLEAVSQAQVPSISYINSPHVGVADLNLLTASVLPGFGPDCAAEIAALGKVTIRDLTLSGKVSIVDVSSTRLNIAFQGFGKVLRELLRADLDGDGVEEILVQHYIYAIGGSLGVSFIGVLRRQRPDALLECEPWIPHTS